MDNWRTFLYLPLGLIPSIFFTSRVLIQWWQSEKRKTSYVSPLFWRLSILGQITLFLHYVIQVQFPFALIQATNLVLAWRNLNLMGPDSKRKSFKTTVLLLGLAPLAVALVFILQSVFVIGEMDWIRTPTKSWDDGRIRHATLWHIIGTIGGFLFASRFWVQWWSSEKKLQSRLEAPFWWVSLAGTGILLVYFFIIGDTINLVNYGFGLIPITRNLMLLLKPKMLKEA